LLFHAFSSPSVRDFDYTGVRFGTNERSEVIPIKRDEDTGLRNCEVIDWWIFQTTQVEVVPNMLYIKVSVKPRKELASVHIFVKQ
jgi:hypothetical protein